MEYNITTESAASSSSPSTHQWKYDVFLSFRGADTRFSVVDPLYGSLFNRGIATFWADDQLKKGGDIPREIFEAIEKSRISVVIFSKNYASSTWCLDELAKIIECKNSQQQIVLPIFCDVDPSDVIDQTGTFGEAFVEHEDRFKDDLEKVSRWRAALAEATKSFIDEFEDFLEAPGLSGMVVHRDGYDESKFINAIIEKISRQLNRTYLAYETDYLVGIDSRLQEVNDLLGVGVDDVRMVGIWGNGGMGKTTLAAAVYNSVAHKFEGSCFLGNVAKEKSQLGLVRLQWILLHDILKEEISGLTNADSGVDIIKRRLHDKRVLLIIDDVDDLNQLKCLAGSSDWFGAGSRIIITTRYEHLLLDHKVDFTYQVKELEPDEAMELFHSKAFPTSRIPNDYLEPASRVVGYAQGNPLDLIDMGSFLGGKSIDEWHPILERYERAPASNIQEILKIIEKEHDSQSTGLNEMPEADYVDGVNATETNKGSLGGDETSPDTQKKDQLGDVTGPRKVKNNEELHEFIALDGVRRYSGVRRRSGYMTLNSNVDVGVWEFGGRIGLDAQGGGIRSSGKRFLSKGLSDRIFLIISLILEIISAICDQLSSSEKPEFAVIGMILAIVALVVCVSELIYKCRKRKFEFGRCRMCLWWFFCPETQRLFGTLSDLFGLICGISQCASSIVQCACVLRHKDNPFKVTLLPIIFLICVGGSKLFEDCKRCTKYSGSRSPEDSDRSEADKSEADKSDVEAAEPNKGSPGGDETSSDTPKDVQLGVTITVIGEGPTKADFGP